MRKAKLLNAVAVCVLAAPHQAVTQETVDSAASPEVERRAAGRLEEVIVTARRVEESLQDTPVSVAAFSQADLQRLGVSEAGDIARFTPNLEMRKQPASEDNFSVAIRGMATTDPVLTFDPTIGLYLDGVYIARAAAMAFDIVDLKRIEVLRGPQGTLFGRNTIGGAINLVTEKPRGELALRQELGIGERGHEKLKTTLDLPRMWGVSLRLSGLHKARDGLVESLYDGRDIGQTESRAGRVALNWAALEQFSLDYTYDRSLRENQPNLHQISHTRDIYASPDGRFYGGPYYETMKAHSSSSRLGKLPIQSTDDDDSTSDIVGHTLTMEWGVLPSLTVKSISSYRNWNMKSRLSDFGSFPAPDDGSLCRSPFPGDYEFVTGNCLNPVPAGELVPIFAAARLPIAQKQKTQELQFIGSALDERLRYTAGLYYFEEQGKEFNPQRLVLPAAFAFSFVSEALVPQNRGNAVIIDLPHFRYTTDNVSYAAYGDFTYNLTPRMEFTAGFRYTVDERETTLTNTLATEEAPRGELTTVSDEDRWSNFNPSLNLSYRWTDSIMTYARATTGYRAGGYNARARSVSSFKQTYDEENVVAFELGWKSELLDRRLRFNGALYYSDYTDQQIPQFEAGSGGASTVVVNAGESTHSGVELEAVWLPFDRVRMALSYAYLDLEYDKFVTGRVDPVTGFATNPGVNEDISDVASTDRIAPDHSASLMLEYALHPWSWGQLILRADAGYTDKIDFTSQLNKFDSAAAHTLINARAILSDLSVGQAGNLQVSAWGRNLTNKSYREYGIDFGVVGFAMNTYGELRAYGLELVYSYNR